MKKLLLLCLLLTIALVASATAQLSIIETSVDFGSGATGATLSSDITVNSTGTAPFTFDINSTVFEIAGSNPSVNFTAAAINSQGIGANAQGPYTVPVAIPSSQAVGTYTGILYLQQYDNNLNNATVPVTLTVTSGTTSANGTMVIVESAVTAAITYKNLENNDNQVNKTVTFTVRNDAAVSKTATLALVGIPSGVTASLSDTSVTLESAATKTVTVTLTVPATYDSGITDIGDIKLTRSDATTQTVDLKIDVESMLKIDDLDVDVGDDSDTNLKNGDRIDVDARPGDEIIMTFSIKNLFDKDFDDGRIKDIDLVVKIDDSDFGKDVDEDDGFDLKEAEETESVITFDVPRDADTGTYDIEITLDGKDDSGAKHTVEWTIQLRVDKERDDVRITRADMSPSTVQCGDTAALRVEIANFGSDEQSKAALAVFNSALNLNSNFDDIDLDDNPSRSSNKFSRTVNINVPASASPGRYEVEVIAYIDDDEETDRELVDLTVTCDEEEEEVVVPITNTQEDTGANQVTGGTVVESVEKPFTESPVFIALLVLVNLVVLAAIILLAVKFLF